MYSKTRFSQIVEGVSRKVYDIAEKLTDASRYAKRFSARSHLFALIYGQLNGSNSLRTLTDSFNQLSHDFYHLDVSEIKRSTLADANKRRNPEYFKHIADELMKVVKGKQKRDLKEMLYILDATPIPLKGIGFDKWIYDDRVKRSKGLKVHTAVAGECLAPTYINITSPNVNDVTDAVNVPIEAGATYIFDKGYTSYNWWYEMEEKGAFFVTRMKVNAAITVLSEQEVDGEIILKDETVTFKHKSNRANHKNHYHGTPLRKITLVVEYKDKPLVLFTNDFNRSAEEIADLYRYRWQIELFFKWIKQNLKIKRFLGRTRNAVIIQIYAAIITYLLLWLYRKRFGLEHVSFHALMAQLQPVLGLREETKRHREYRKKRREREKYIHDHQGVLPI